MTKRFAIALSSMELERISELARLRESTVEALALEAVLRALEIIRGGGEFMPPEKVDIDALPLLPEAMEFSPTQWRLRAGMTDPVQAVIQSRRPIAEAEDQALSIFSNYEPGSCYSHSARRLASSMMLYAAFDPSFEGPRTLLTARQMIDLGARSAYDFLYLLKDSDVLGGYVSSRADRLLSPSLRTREAEEIHVFMWGAFDVFFEKPDGKQLNGNPSQILVVRLPDPEFTELMGAAFKRRTSISAFGRWALAPADRQQTAASADGEADGKHILIRQECRFLHEFYLLNLAHFDTVDE